MITRTDSQALVRVRGMLGPTGWCERLKEPIARAQARKELLGWLDFLTLLVRSTDLLSVSPAVLAAVLAVRNNTRAAIGPYRVGDAHLFKGTGLPPLRTIHGDGWDWDDAFSNAEERTGKQS